jgi:ASC-1-like (ASCH) protein
MSHWDVPIEDEWGLRILQGLKKLEGKKHSKKWKGMKIGDSIGFTLSFTKFTADVIDIRYYLYKNDDGDQLTQLLIMEGINNCLPGVETLKEARKKYLEFYELDDIKKDGMMAIFIKPQGLRIKSYYICILDTNYDREFLIEDKIPDDESDEIEYFKYQFPLPEKSKLRCYLCSYLFPSNSQIYYYEDFHHEEDDKYNEIKERMNKYFVNLYDSDDENKPIFMQNISKANDSNIYFMIVLNSYGEIKFKNLIKN